MISQASPSTDWSPLSGYQNSTFSPSQSTLAPSINSAAPNHQRPLDTPPISVHSSATSNVTDAPPLPHQMNRMPTNNSSNHGNPSPPSSVAGRSSIGTVNTMGVVDEKKLAAIEAALAEHHRTLVRYLAPYLRELRADPRQNRARDKLLRLSAGQFQELSTDVYDELTRREEERRRGGPELPGNPVPKYLLPRQNFHFKRNQARQKLSTLPGDRFQQLATDVFFELERRFPRFARAASRADSIPDRDSPSRNGFGPRSGSRLGPDPRAGGDGFASPALSFAQPKMYQSNVMVPNKGTMVEDDDDVEATRMLNGDDSQSEEYRAQIAELENKVDDLVSQLREKEKELEDTKNSNKNNDNALDNERSRWKDLQEELESKVLGAQALNDSLQSEIAKIKSRHADLEEELQVKTDQEMSLRLAIDQGRRDADDRERALQSQMEDHHVSKRTREQDLLAEMEQVRNQAQMQSQMRGVGDSEVWKDRCEQMERELMQQRKLTDDVRRETATFLAEMRTLSQKSTESVEKEEQLLDQVVSLEREVRVWKARYAKSKSQARSLRSSAMGLPNASDNTAQMARDAAFIADNGVIRDVHLTNFQLAVDDLLQQARTSDPDFISESMKQVIMAVRSITSDMEVASPTMNGDSNDSSVNKKNKLRGRLSQAANNLISATKAYGASHGIAPVSIVDAAALHLTTAVVDTIKLFKIRPSTPEELAQEDFGEIVYSARPPPLNTGIKGIGSSESSAISAVAPGHLRNGSASSAGFSNYSRYSSRYSVNTSPEQPSAEMKNTIAAPGILGMLRENGIEEFKNYLEDSTALLVRSIQPLVNTIRSSPDPSESIVAEYVRDIDSTVSDIVTKTNMALADLKNPALGKHAPPVVSVLKDTVAELNRTMNGGQLDRLPPLAFRVARATKELVLRVDRIETGEVTAAMDLGNDF